LDTFVYQYTVGSIIFFAGLYFAWKQGYVGLKGKACRNLVVMLGGLTLFMALQGYLQYGPMNTADPQPYTGEGLSSGRHGTYLDYGVMVSYFLAILAIGTFFGKRQKTTKDFFFGGQRFSWWLIAFSLVATTIGSYSFVKYSKVAYQYGLSSSQTYLNDWFWVPLFLFGWLPIIYFSRVVSIPEYFERRFNSQVRRWATALILIYLIGYVGVNLFTMGKALNILLGWEIFWAAVLVASISAVYVTAGGQTSVIMTDLFQGVMLLATGIMILWLGADYLGGFDGLWENLPRGHRQSFANFNEDPGFNGVGIFWQDAVANTAVFYFLNQGIMMRFMAARSVDEGRKAAVVVPLILMPVAACVVASGGWVGKAIENAGGLPQGMDPAQVFFIATDFLCSTPGLFGLVMASLTAALMSTVDTLITAVAAIVVNDIYKPYFRPDAGERDLLKVARWTSIGVTLLGIALVPVFMTFDSIYEAHGAFTAAVTPPLVITLLLSVFWKRFTAKAAVWTMGLGLSAIIFSVFVPEVITPFAHGIPMKEVEDSLFAGKDQYKYIRAFYGLVVCAVIAVAVTLMSRPEGEERMRGLVWGTIEDALRNYKGKDEARREAKSALAAAQTLEGEEVFVGDGHLAQVNLSAGLAQAIEAREGDLLYISDTRRWLGGLRSTHAIVGSIYPQDEPSVKMGPLAYDSVVAPGRQASQIKVERTY